MNFPVTKYFSFVYVLTNFNYEHSKEKNGKDFLNELQLTKY